MSEPVRQQIGDGQDDFGQAAGKLVEAAKQARAVSQGVQAATQAANAAITTAQASGGAAAEVAAGSAAGPWGALLAAAWASRHTLFKVLVCACLGLLIIIVLIVSLPSIVSNGIFGLDGVQPADGATILATYNEMAEVVDGAVDNGYNQALAQVEEIITSGGYDYRLSMDALSNYAHSSAGYDACYILAAYSASMEQKDTSKADLTAKLVWAAGDHTSGTIQPYGLDCSGFTDWVYKTALGMDTLGMQWESSHAVSAAELQPGDLGFLGGRYDWTHVLMFAGYGESGQRMWVHSSGGEGVILNTPSYEAGLNLRRVDGVDFDAPAPGGGSELGTPISTLEVDVTHYCACTLCCGENAAGITASGKRVSQGMVAMSSHYPFGTQIKINGVMYTVEDRGGSGIENDIRRVDIYVPDHNEALRLGRFTTTAQIYRIGR